MHYHKRYNIVLVLREPIHIDRSDDSFNIDFIAWVIWTQISLCEHKLLEIADDFHCDEIVLGHLSVKASRKKRLRKM